MKKFIRVVTILYGIFCLVLVIIAGYLYFTKAVPGNITLQDVFNNTSDAMVNSYYLEQYSIALIKAALSNPWKFLAFVVVFLPFKDWRYFVSAVILLSARLSTDGYTQDFVYATNYINYIVTGIYVIGGVHYLWRYFKTGEILS